MRNFNRPPSDSRKYQSATPVALLAVFALAISGCGEGKARSHDNNKSGNNTPKSVTVTDSKQPHVEGQPEISVTYYPNGTAMSKFVGFYEDYEDSPWHSAVTFYSCVGKTHGDLLTVSTKADSRAGASSQFVEDAKICAGDGRIVVGELDGGWTNSTS
ncbi:hypothetical protein A3F37_02890 [Candidatus Saccharibacteria bacterium RIFCSPHIGHO2_12_FULL_41_12]|nr:MAG: hypothetical protein A3F37_02890 [Candidatus Saccharibacteria bacterium RIFCSPHIGHO2_12_FULL_41_12]